MYGPIDGVALYEALAGAGVGFFFGFLFGCDWARAHPDKSEP
jgi:hypothetical protein